MGRAITRLLILVLGACLVPACGGGGGSAGWRGETLLETINTGHASDPEVVVDAAGNATVAWTQSDGSTFSIYSNRFDQTTGTWGGATLVETDDTGVASGVHLAVDPSGFVMAVWHQFDGTLVHIYSNRLDPSTGTWGTPVMIETGDAGDSGFPREAGHAHSPKAVGNETVPDGLPLLSGETSGKPPRLA